MAEQDDGLPRIEAGRCLGCGECVALCPSGTLAMERDTARVTGRDCIGCGHCQAVCPAEAVVCAADGWAEAFATFRPSGRLVAPGDFAPAALVDLLRSRRSCRRFRPDPVAVPLLDDLVRVAVTAPSGTNSQRWSFTVLATRPAVEALGEAVAGFYRRLNALAARPVLRKLLSWLGRGELEDYYRKYFATVSRSLAAWDRDRTDRLFHGAPAVILVGSRPGASCPAEDALLASQNLLLGAHALGLGSCLVGYAVEPIRHDRQVRAAIGLPRGESVQAVIALGWPAVTFVRPTARRRPLVRVRLA